MRAHMPVLRREKPPGKLDRAGDSHPWRGKDSGDPSAGMKGKIPIFTEVATVIRARYPKRLRELSRARA